MSTATLERVTFATSGGVAMQLAAEGKMVPFEGDLALEDATTGDRRGILKGAIYWENLPLSLMAQFENPVGGDGHDGAVLAGRIDAVWRDGDLIRARGWIDPAAPGGLQLINALDKGTMRGVSVDLDMVEAIEIDDPEDGGRWELIVRARLRGATATSFAAFIDATIWLLDQVPETLVAAGAQGRCARAWRPFDPTESLAQALTASAGNVTELRRSPIPVDPPRAWFDKPALTELTPLTITPEGRVFGHIAAWGGCHISFGRCVPVPRSRTRYAKFRCGSVVTAEGETVRTGPLIMDTVHPDLKRSASDAQAFYAHTGCAVADLVPYEDEFGICVAGALRPTVTPVQVRALRGSDVSPDWRNVDGFKREMVAMLAVNNGGFKVPQTLVASGVEYVEPGVVAVYEEDGDVLALVAAGGNWTPGEATGGVEMAEQTDETTAGDVNANPGGCGGSCECGGTCGTFTMTSGLVTTGDPLLPAELTYSIGLPDETDEERAEFAAWKRARAHDALMARFATRPRQFTAPQARRVFRSRS